MPILPGLRGMFVRRKPFVEIEVTGTQAESSRRSTEDHHNGGAVDAGADAMPVVSRAHPRPAAPSARGSDEVIGLIRQIGDHLDKQSEHTHRLDALIDRLPEAIDALPELNRQNARLLDVLGDHLERARSREDMLQSTLVRMSETSNHQTDVLGLVRQQLDTGNLAVAQMTETLGSVRQTLTDLSGATTRSVQMLSEMVQISERRSTELTKLFGRTQRWMLAALVCCGVVSVAAAVVAIVGLVT